MAIDIYTLSLALGFINLLLGFALYIQYRFNRSYGLGWWTFGVIFVAAGFGLNILRDHPTLGIPAVIVDNIFFVTGFELLYVGVLRFFGRRERVWMLLVYGGIYLALIFCFTCIDDNIAIRRVLFSFSVALFMFLIGRAFLVYKTRSIALLSNLLAVLFFINAIFFAARAIIPTSAISIDEDFIATPIQMITYLVSLASSTMWTFGVTILVNQRLNAENREARENLELIFNTSPDAVLISRLADGRLEKVNEGFTTLTGYSPAEVIGKTTLGINYWQNPADRQRMVGLLNKDGHCENQEFVFQRKDGSQFTGLISARIIILQDVAHMISVTHNISDRKRMEAALRESEEKYRFMTENSGDVIWHVDKNYCFDYLSPADERLRGFKREEVIGKTFWSLLTPEGAENLIQANAKRLAEEQLGIRTGTIKYELEQICKDGGWIWTEINVSPHHDQNGELIGYHGVTRDITERKHLQEELKQQATTDVLTGASNRRHFLDLAHGELRRALRSKRSLAMVLIDIDHFKQINDTYGHAVGDLALQAFTNICMQNIREVDVFARFGGDEFVLLLPEIDCPQAVKVVERIRQHLVDLPIDAEGQTLPPMTVSAGISCLEGENETLDTILGRADKALYESKAGGRNRIMVNLTHEI